MNLCPPGISSSEVVTSSTAKARQVPRNSDGITLENIVDVTLENIDDVTQVNIVDVTVNESCDVTVVFSFQQQ